jgi:hypothetical protein
LAEENVFIYLTADSTPLQLHSSDILVEKGYAMFCRPRTNDQPNPNPGIGWKTWGMEIDSG